MRDGLRPFAVVATQGRGERGSRERRDGAKPPRRRALGSAGGWGMEKAFSTSYGGVPPVQQTPLQGDSYRG